jgi:hypothetical protein
MPAAGVAGRALANRRPFNELEIHVESGVNAASLFNRRMRLRSVWLG